MPLYVGDYLRDTGDLTTVEHGAYLLLIMQAWTRGGALPVDGDRLRSLTRMSEVDWQRSGATIMGFFYLDGEVFRHKRIDQELATATTLTEQRRTAGKASAEARNAQRKSNGNPTADQREVNGRSTGVEVSLTSPLPSRSTSVEVSLERNARPSPSQSKKDSVLRTDADRVVKEPDARDRLWAVGLPALQAMTGAPGSKSRGMIGRLVKAARDDCALVLAVLQEAEGVRPIDPFPWLLEAIMARTDRREGPAEQLARELDFSFDSLPRASDFDSEGNLIHGFAEPASDRHLVAYDAEARDPTNL